MVLSPRPHSRSRKMDVKDLALASNPHDTEEHASTLQNPPFKIEDFAYGKTFSQSDRHVLDGSLVYYSQHNETLEVSSPATVNRSGTIYPPELPYRNDSNTPFLHYPDPSDPQGDQFFGGDLYQNSSQQVTFP